MIEVTGLSKYYSGHRAIEDITFQIKRGEIVGLLGLNGAGKSTILKILGCFLMPSGGKASVDGHYVDKDPHDIRKVIGFLPDHTPVYDEMPVISFLKYVAKLKEVPSSQINAKVDAAIQKTNIEEVVKYRLGALSHGFRQRVGIAQAIVHEPKVLILDEPISGLDPIQIVEMRDLVVSFRGQHTVVLSSHILSEITKTCDRILIIDNGKLLAEGKESDLETSLAKNMHLVLDVESGGEKVVDTLKGLHGVTNIRVEMGPHGGPRISLETEDDLRTKISHAVIKANVGLVSFYRVEAGLESLFMKLIHAENKTNH